MTTMNRGLQTFFAYKFIKLLVNDFKKWEAYKLGLIDENGRRTDKRASSTLEKQQVGVFMNLTRKVKRMLQKIPGGRTTFGSIIAASILLKEECFNQGEVFLSEEFLDQVFQELSFNAESLNTSIDELQESLDNECLSEGIYTIKDEYSGVFGKKMFYVNEEVQPDSSIQFPVYNLTDVYGSIHYVSKEMLKKINA